MKRKLLAVAITSLMAFGGTAAVAGAHHQDGHEANYHGMCTAYFSGSENGQEKKRDNGNAFSVFEETVGDRDDDDDVDAYDVADFCNEVTGGFGNPGGGNDPYFGDSTCGFEEEECTALEDQEGGTTPGESNGNKKNG